MLKIRGILDSADEQDKHRFKAVTHCAISPAFALRGCEAAAAPRCGMDLDGLSQTLQSAEIDIAAAIGGIALAFKPYQQAFIDNGLDGTMLRVLRDQSEEETL